MRGPGAKRGSPDDSREKRVPTGPLNTVRLCCGLVERGQIVVNALLSVTVLWCLPDFCGETPNFTRPNRPGKINLKVEESCPERMWSLKTIQLRTKY